MEQQQSAVVAMEVAKHSVVGRKRKHACAVGWFTLSFLLCSAFSPTVFVFDSLKICTMASKEAYLATEMDRARGCNLEDSNLVAVIEDYFEGRPWKSPQQEPGKTTLSLHWLAGSRLSNLGELTLCSVIMYVMCK